MTDQIDDNDITANNINAEEIGDGDVSNEPDKDKIFVVPFVPLRDIVIFPGMQGSFYVGRAETLASITASLKEYDKHIFLGTQKDPNCENPTDQDVYNVGVVAKIINVKTDSSKNQCTVTVQGLFRAGILKCEKDNNLYKIHAEMIYDINDCIDNHENELLLTSLLKDLSKYVRNANQSVDIIKKLAEIGNIEILTNTLISHIDASLQSQIEILQERNSFNRLKLIHSVVSANLAMANLDKKIMQNIHDNHEKQNKEFFINEKIKELQKELSEIKDTPDDIYENEKKFDDFVENSGMNKLAKEKAKLDAKRLRSMPGFTPDAGILRTYLDWLVQLPWSEKSEEILNYTKSKEILNADHYGLKKVKQRILEFIAVRNLNSQIHGPILCFVGPPGVGKTSLSRSVAKALGREFVRISLGGVRDEAEIRGHRRTYLGALPGKIIQSMKKAKTVNPVFLLDEIDKMTSDMRGDPASALLEVLDPEQNSGFMDHYLEVPYDLSEVMFITTANSMQGIPYPLRDRMEIINIGSYTENEKLHITKKFLISREKKENGIENINLEITDDAIIGIIRHYTMEAGVRSLQRQIATICRKVAKQIVLSETDKKDAIVIDKKNLTKYLGKKKITRSKSDKILTVGMSHGLAWSELGGTLLPIECVIYPGNGKIILTGKLGDVMKESVQTAYSYIRSQAHQFNIKYNDFYKKYDVHVHFPEGATPKDGPSGGIAIACAILSALTKTPMLSTVAMTGEITLTGKVLPIGGLKEKVLAAAQHKKKTVIIPLDNKKDLVDIPKSVVKRIEFKTVTKAREVFKLVFPAKIYKKNNDNQSKTVKPNDNQDSTSPSSSLQMKSN